MQRLLKTLLLLLCFHNAYAQKDTLKLYYNIGVAQLSAASMQTIDSAVYFERLQQGKKLAIVGYADYLGSEQSNIHLSENRAKTVQQYLEKMGIDAKDIQIVIGKGEVVRKVLNGTAGYVTDRRVDIIPGGIPEPLKKPVPPAVIKPAVPQIDISKATKNTTITLENLYFEPGSHKVREVSFSELFRLYNTMKENPQLKIGIEGHICCLPPGNSDGYDYDSEDFNLSRNRAIAIYEYLIQKGISADRMTYKGFGISKPLFMPEENEEQENKNRRVEIRILAK
jgi:outer membrane protein OmpA-like peptidoglycan-associated protein